MVDVWEACKQKLYGEDSCPGQVQSSAGHLQSTGIEGQMDGKLCSLGKGETQGNVLLVCTCVCGSACNCGCVVDGSGARAAS